jgi:two-component system sporulation sensor kinase A/two-component system, sporulation sensor kinase E
LLGRRLNSQGVDVQRALDAHLPPVWGRANEVMQVLMNLLVNALDAMPRGGQLQLQTTSEPEGAICIRVVDTGSGIASDLQVRIFEPFVTTKEHGTGLGLAISEQIVRQHGGSITVASTPGQGAAFSVWLPCSAPVGG